MTEEEIGKDEFKIVISKETVEQLSKILNEFKELRKQRRVELGNIVKKLGGCKTEIELSFNKLTLDGSIKIRIMPLKKE
ncbi:MAG: hypothetical protein J7J42_05070 [Thermoplasmata archaeon]|nr:hypothetical protein [Thermoplasmata archaeon]